MWRRPFERRRITLSPQRVGIAGLAVCMILVGGASWLTIWPGRVAGEVKAVLWTAGVGAALVAMVIMHAARRETFAIWVVRWFAGLESVLREIRYPLARENLRSLGDWVASLYANHAGWVLLVRAPGVLIRGEIARQQYLRVGSDAIRGSWDVGWAEGFLRDLLEGETRRNGIVISLPEGSAKARSLLCWVCQSDSHDVAAGIVVGLPVKADGSHGLIPAVMTAALDMIVHRLGSLLAEVISRKSGLGGRSTQDSLLLVRALVHELSGELHPTLVYLDSKDGSTSGDQVDMVRRVRSMLTKTGYWIDLLRDVPIVQDDFLSIARNRVSLVPVIRQILDEIRPAWPDASFHLELEGEPQVVGDDHLRSVIRNVLFNAASFSPPEGTVDILVLQDGLYARVYIDDEGPGVTPDRIETIFDPYAASKRNGDGLNGRIRQGMGIGLSIARTIVRGYGGDLRCHSNHNGSGGRFEIMLPLALDETEEDHDAR